MPKQIQKTAEEIDAIVDVIASSADTALRDAMDNNSIDTLMGMNALIAAVVTEIVGTTCAIVDSSAKKGKEREAVENAQKTLILVLQREIDKVGQLSAFYYATKDTIDAAEVAS